MNTPKILGIETKEELIKTLKNRFEKNMARHKDIAWTNVKAKLTTNKEKLWSLYQMENTGGEPDVIDYNPSTDEYFFYDCSPESPVGRRSLCYDKQALDKRKEFKPVNNAIDVATKMGIEILNEDQYRYLQKFGNFDNKTSSWIKTPDEIRKLGGAIFGDFRYNTVFVYHNGAQSYYAARGFRGFLKI